MQYGDYTDLAKYYKYRPRYSKTVLKYFQCYIQNDLGKIKKTADVGAGTGKLTEDLVELGLEGYAVEPNFAMRNEGMKRVKEKGFIWKEGQAECTNLDENSVDWVLMGSSFHWTDSERALKEFYRILKPGGYFTAIWNPRNIGTNEVHIEIEKCIYKELPQLKRISSGKNFNTQYMKEKMCSNGLFDDLVFIEAEHIEDMSKERYLNIWRSVNDIRVQAGSKRFEIIMAKIEQIIQDLEIITVPYLSKAWTVKSKKKS